MEINIFTAQSASIFVFLYFRKQINLVQFHDFEQKLADLTFLIVNSNKNENFFFS